jgi:hypothetical protein
MSTWKITYMGEGIAQLDGIGNFQKHTTASVTEGVATGLKGDTRWVVVGPGAPAPAATPAKAEAKPAPKAEEKPAPKAEEKPAPKADEKPAAKADEKPAAKADEKPAAKA